MRRNETTLERANGGGCLEAHGLRLVCFLDVWQINGKI